MTNRFATTRYQQPSSPPCARAFMECQLPISCITIRTACPKVLLLRLPFVVFSAFLLLLLLAAPHHPSSSLHCACKIGIFTCSVCGAHFMSLPPPIDSLTTPGGAIRRGASGPPQGARTSLPHSFQIPSRAQEMIFTGIMCQLPSTLPRFIYGR